MAMSPKEFGIEIESDPDRVSTLATTNATVDALGYRDLFGMSRAEKRPIQSAYKELRNHIGRRSIDDMWGQGWPELHALLRRHAHLESVTFPDGTRHWILLNNWRGLLMELGPKQASVVQMAVQEEFAGPGGFEALVDALEREGKLFKFESHEVVTATLRMVDAGKSD
jgi:hypothetical protein